jgi:hypothetical protein
LRGHITRGAWAGDRRSVLIELTHAGRGAADTIVAAIAGLEQRALAGLPGQAVAGCRTVRHALTEVPPHERARRAGTPRRPRSGAAALIWVLQCWRTAPAAGLVVRFLVTSRRPAECHRLWCGRFSGGTGSSSPTW